jgi:hypothetical protein
VTSRTRIREALVHLLKVGDDNREGPLAAVPSVPRDREPDAWSYELATSMIDGEYAYWSERITRDRPNVPDGAVRNLIPLYRHPAREVRLGAAPTEVSELGVFGIVSSEGKWNYGVFTSEGAAEEWRRETFGMKSGHRVVRLIARELDRAALALLDAEGTA